MSTRRPEPPHTDRFDNTYAGRFSPSPRPRLLIAVFSVLAIRLVKAEIRRAIQRAAERGQG